MWVPSGSWSWPVEPQDVGGPSEVSAYECRVGYVHARSVMACGLDGQIGELFERPMRPGRLGSRWLGGTSSKASVDCDRRWKSCSKTPASSCRWWLRLFGVSGQATTAALIAAEHEPEGLGAAG